MERKQLVVFGMTFAVVVAVLALFYMLFLRQDYVVLFADIREQDTAEIVAELERLGLDYQLADGGHAILVPESSEEEARIAIAGSDIAMGGVVGFELFNESDMGLTEFAQQVNYQRALQGELARTIMMMEGIAFARVHITLPERSLFRDDNVGPRAAVTVQPRPGAVVGADRVRGIQRLVASAVSQLDADDVSIIDEHGRLISRELPAGGPAQDDPDEKTALEAYFQARVRAAVAPLLPGTEYAVRVDAIRLARPPAGEADEDAQESEATTASSARDFSLNIAIRTDFEISESDQVSIGEVVAAAAALQPANGDTLRFEIADLATPVGADAYAEPVAPIEVDEVALAPAADGPEWIEELLFTRWTTLVLLLLAVITLPLLRRRGRLSGAERASFAEEVELLLTRREERSHG